MNAPATERKEQRVSTALARELLGHHERGTLRMTKIQEDALRDLVDARKQVEELEERLEYYDNPDSDRGEP